MTALFFLGALLASLAGWVLRGAHEERRSVRAGLRRLTEGHRLDLAIEAERELVKRNAALEEANLAWSSAPVVVSLERWRRRTNGNDAA